MHLIRHKFSSKIDFSEKGKLVSYLNIYNYLLLRKKVEVLRKTDYFTFDGFLFQYLFFLLTGKFHKRMAPDFGSYLSEMFVFLNNKKESVYFLGAKNEELYQFVSVIQNDYPNIVIKGVHHGYFTIEDEPEILNNIKRLSPNKVFLGLGSPKQEEFSLKIKSMCHDSMIFNCGAFISQTANNGKEYYPKFINQLNLRWIYRIYKEKGLLRRYAVDYPKGIVYIVKDRFFP